MYTASTPIYRPMLVSEAKLAEAPGCDPEDSGFESRRSPQNLSRSPNGEEAGCNPAVCRFDSDPALQIADWPVAQLAAYLTLNQGVTGSNPVGPAKI